MKIDAKKYIKFFEFIILSIGFFVAACIYAKAFFSSALMCFIISVYTIISMMIIAFISSAYHLAMNKLVKTHKIVSYDEIATALNYHGEIIIKIGYILFVFGASVIYLLQFIL